MASSGNEFFHSRALLESALALHQQAGDAAGESQVLAGLGYVARCQGDLPAGPWPGA